MLQGCDYGPSEQRQQQLTSPHNSASHATTEIRRNLFVVLSTWADHTWCTSSRAWRRPRKVVKCSRREHRAADEELSRPHAAGMRHLATRHHRHSNDQFTQAAAV